MAKILASIEEVASALIGDEQNAVLNILSNFISALLLVLISPVLILTALVRAFIFVGNRVEKLLKEANSYFKDKYKHGQVVVPALISVIALCCVALIALVSIDNSPLSNYRRATIKAIHVDKNNYLNGIDISKHQMNTYKKLIDDEDVDFVIVRAANGKTVDRFCDSIYQYAKAHKKLLGVYFYADRLFRENNDAREHARWCAEQTVGYQGWSIFALDIENRNGDPKGNKVETSWADAWLDEFVKVTGIRPFVYMNSNTENINDWSEYVTKNYPLWLAHYFVPIGKPKYAHWEQWSVHQYTDKVTDLDVFAGSARDWWKYAKTA